MQNNSTNITDSEKLQSISYSSVMEFIESNFVDCPDIIRRPATLKDDKDCCFIFIEDLINTDILQRDFISPLLSMEQEELSNEKRLRNLPVARISFFYDTAALINDVVTGGVVFIYEGMSFGISCRLDKVEKRSIEEPETEKNVRGAHEGFIEPVKTNMAIIRRRVKNKNLKFKIFQLGETTNQTVAVAYIQGIANPTILSELCSRIQKINMDGLIGSGYIEQLISDKRNSPFPQFLATERPDKAVAALLEGRFVILLDGTPVTIIAPVTFVSFFQTPDDFNSSWSFATFVGILRLIAIIIALYLPAIYIAVTAYHYYMVPLKLLIPLAESREKIPFPPFLEAVIMELTIELIREATIRLPTYIGSSIGIIGGIIIGQAAVQAGIVSVLMIIVISVTAIASYAAPIYGMSFALRLYRFLAMIAASILGVAGILSFGIILLAHLLSLESLGQPYLQPIVPLRIKDLKNAFIRLPLQYMKKRPADAQPVDDERGSKENE